MNLNSKNFPPTITSINLGDNHLTSLKLTDFPNLTRLIISHNTKLIRETIMIKNCPQLNINDIFHYKSDDAGRGTPEDGRKYGDERDNPFKRGEKENEETKKTT
ncbi:MAG: hypothetical protein LBR43_01680 [Spiroplasmataceae bacterium]|jgi:hypothetical protein|nr:hypothetical protein [Spiroplasmataceae bacterium]